MSSEQRTLPRVAGERWVEVGEASEAFIEVLNANGVDHMFLMPGTDTFPIQEAIAKYQALGKRVPRVITALHESTAMSAAHGYYMVTGKPQVCLVHVDVGLQMIGGMLHNAQRGRAGVILCSGRTPITSHGELRGGRDLEIHWIQDRRDQPSVVRDYVKWYYELTRAENLNHVMQRAFQVAATEPSGPVYMSFLRELLMERMGGVRLLPPERYGPAVLGVPPVAHLERLAQALVEARRPIIVAGFTGRTRAGFEALSDLARALSIPVFVRPNRAHISSDHPMFLPGEPGGYLEEADLVLLLDADVPYRPLVSRPPDDALIALIDADPIKIDFPVWGFPIDIALQGDTAATLPILQELFVDRLTKTDRDRLSERADRIGAEQQRRVSELRAKALAGEQSVPITVEYLSACIAELVDEGTIVVDDSVTSSAVASQFIPMRAGSYFRHGGSSMGWGGGASLGAKLAAPDKTVINLNADGNFIDGVPEASLWAAEAYGAPFLTVIYNNGQFGAVKRNLLDAYPDGYASRTALMPGIDLPNLPDFLLIAASCRAHGERITDPRELRAALHRGLETVRGGRSSVLDVMVTGPSTR